MKALLASLNPFTRRSSKLAHRRLSTRGGSVEPLEARIAPAYTVTLAATVASFVGGAGTETLTITESAGLLMHDHAADPGFADAFDFSTAVAGSQHLTANAASVINVNDGGGGDTITATRSTDFTAGTISAVGGSINLTTTAGAITKGATGPLTATNLTLSATTGLGLTGTHLTTAVSKLEATTGTGGIFIDNTGALTIGGTSASLSGVQVTGASGDISLNATGTINVNVNGQIVKGPGNVGIFATGGTSDIHTGGNNGAPSLPGAVASTGAASTITLSAGQDVLIGDSTSGNPGFGDVQSAGSISLSASRDIIIDRSSFVNAHGTGTVTGTAGRNVSFLVQASGVGDQIGTEGGTVSLTSTAANGLLTMASAATTIKTGGGNVTLTFDQISIGASDGIDAGAGTVTLKPFTSSQIINLGAADAPGTLGVTDAELGRITAGVVQIGDFSHGAALTISSAITRHAGFNTLVLKNNGPITQTAALSVAKLDAEANSSVTLQNAGNDVDTLAGLAGGGGNFSYTDSNAVTIDTVAGNTTLHADNNVTIVAGGTLTISKPIDSFNTTVSLTTTDAAGTGNDIIINSTGSLSSGGGGVTLHAGDNVTIASGASVTTTGPLAIVGDFGNADAGVGSTVLIAGTIDGSSIAISGNSDDDSFTLGGGMTDVTIGNSVTVDGLGGTNSLTLNDTADATGDTVTTQPTGPTSGTIGAAPGDNFFAAGVNLTYSNINAATLNLGTGTDTVELNPATGTTFTIGGGAPTVWTGDTLHYLSTGSIHPTAAGAGTITSPGLALVTFGNVELVTTLDFLVTPTPAGVVVTAAGDQDYPGEDDTFAITTDATGQFVALGLNGSIGFYADQGAVSHIDALGFAGNDTLTVDDSNGLIHLPNGVRFDGGTGFNGMQLTQTGGAAQTSDTFTVGPNVGDVRSVIVGPSGTQIISAQNLAPVLDTVLAALLTVNGTNASNAITYTQGSVPANGLVAVDEFETIEFSNKTALTINALGGADTVTIANTSTPTSLTGITVNGGDPAGTDTLIVNGTTGNDAFGYTPSSTVGSGSVTRTGAPTVTFATVEQLSIDGQGGTDALTFTDTTGRRVTYTPGSAPDSGLIEAAGFGAGTGVVPLSFAHIGAIGSVTFAGTGDILQLNGTNHSDTFNVTGSTAQIFNATSGFTSVLLNLSNLFSLELRGLDGDDTFNLSGSLAAISGGLVVDGGNPAGSDTVNFVGAVSPVVIVPGNLVFSSLDTVIGFGAQVSLLGVERLNVNAAFNQVTLAGSFESEDLHVTLDEIQAATITKTGSPLTIHTSNTNALVVAGAGGDDTLTLHGTSGADSISIVRGATTTVTPAGLSLTVSAPAANLENVRIDAGAGADAITVSGTASNGQGLDIVGGSPTSNAGAVADTLNLTLVTAGTTALVPGATPDAGAITSPDGTTTFSGIELVVLTGAAGANTLNLQGTHASDTMAVQFLGGANRAWINDRAVASFANFATVNVNGLFGDDKVSIAPAGLVGVTTINVAGGDPSASDELIVTGTAGADTFTFTGTSASAGTVALAGAPVVNFTTTENAILDGQGGADLFTVASAVGRVQLLGGEGSDTVDFTGAASGVVFDLDAVGVDQHVNTTGEIVALGDVVENFIGTAFNDVLRVKAATVARTLNGGTQVTLPPGDTLVFDGNGAVVNLVPVDSNTGTFKAIGYVDVAFDEFETTSITNSPSGPGGFGSPGSSNAFSAPHIYDQLPIITAGKPTPGKGPGAVVTGDLNGDGFADLVVANTKTRNLNVLINKGDGTFFDPVNVNSFATGAQDIVSGDFNGDTKLDVAVSYPAAGKIAVFNGDGSGGFAAPTQIVTPKFKPFALAVGQMNAGAALDLVATSRDTNAVEVLLGTGTGSFTPGTPVKSLGKQPVDVVLADFNGDGKLDVATANNGSNNVSFFTGDGAGGIGGEVRFATGLRPSSLAVGDLNNDGKLDLAVSNAASAFVSVLLGVGNGGGAQFVPQLRVSVPGVHQSSAIVVGDFDGDGFADIGLGNRVGTNFTILRGLGAATFTLPFEFNLGKAPNVAVTGGIAIADLNNDGLLDIIATSIGSNDTRVLLRKV